MSSDKAQAFKDVRMESMTGRPSLPNVPPVRDPRRDGIKNPAGSGEQMTNLEARSRATPGPRGGGYSQQSGPGMLPK